MSDTAEQTILQNYGSRFTSADDDARVDALLWDGNTVQATNVIMRVSPAARVVAQARLAMLEGTSSGSDGSFLTDPGYVDPNDNPTPITTTLRVR